MEVIRTAEEFINDALKSEKIDTNLISDGYHTFGELYEHRIVLYIAFCKMYSRDQPNYSLKYPEVWKSNTHSDGSVWDGWFLLGVDTQSGKQITYHLPMSYWDQCDFATTLDKAPDFDGHTSADVLERLRAL